MFFFRWQSMLDELVPVQVRRRTRRPPRHHRHLGLELLDGRIMPSTLGTIALVEGPTAGSDSDIVASNSAWNATANDSWLHTTSSGSGNGLTTFTFDANPGATRSGTLTIAGQTLTVTQAGSTYVAAQSLTTLASTTVPSALAGDGSGNVYFADGPSKAILNWNAATQQVVTSDHRPPIRPAWRWTGRATFTSPKPAATSSRNTTPRATWFLRCSPPQC